MVHVLASTDGPSTLFEIINALFSKIDALAHPQHMTNALQHLQLGWSVIFIIAGIMCLMNGYRYYRVVTVLMAAAVGLFGGYYLGTLIEGTTITGYVVAASLGLLLAVACIPMMKYAVAIFGGLTGAFVGANIWSTVAGLLTDSAQAEAMLKNYWIGAFIGLLIFGMLTFILFNLAIVMFTSVSGSLLAVVGTIGLLLQVPTWADSVQRGIEDHSVIIPLLVFVPALIGLIVQESSGMGQKKAAS